MADNGRPSQPFKTIFMTELLPRIELETAPNPEAAVIWLHGLGADGNDFAALVPELDLGDCPPIRFVFPHAPSIPVTVNGGYIMPAWYDILGVNLVDRQDAEGIREVRTGRSCADSERGRTRHPPRTYCSGRV
jgi:predicted esterase